MDFVGVGRPEDCQVLEGMGTFIVWETQQLRGRGLRKCQHRAPALATFFKASFHITVVALCHPAEILKLPGGQNKGGLALRGLVGGRGANILTSLSEQAGAATGCLLPGAGHMEASGLWSVPSSGHCTLWPNCSFGLVNHSDCISHLWVLSSMTDSPKEP